MVACSPGFAFETDVWLDDEVGASSREAVGELVPLLHAEHDAEVATGYVIAIDFTGLCHRAFVGRGVGGVITRYGVGPTARQAVNSVHTVSRPRRPSRVQRIGCRT